MRDGLVVVDKPAGCTSHDVVAKLRKAYEQRRVGHAGTLDPDATGVLLVGLGRATRLLRFLQEAGKSYRGRIVFGIATSTLDASGEIVEQQPMPLARADVEAAVTRFVGELEQLPPMVSAVKVGGRRLHQLAARGRRRRARAAARARRPLRRCRLRAGPLSGSHGAGRVRERHLRAFARRRSRGRARGLRASRHCSADWRSVRSPWPRLTRSTRSSPSPTARCSRSRPPCAISSRSTSTRNRRAPARHGIAFPAGALGETGAGPFALVAPGSELVAVYERRGAACKPAVVMATADNS